MSNQLIRTAKRILGAAKRKPSQADLRRAISTAYYAMFDALARSCAEQIVGSAPAKRSTSEWRRVYRALEHGRSNNALNEIKLEKLFPNGLGITLTGFCETLEKMKQRRHEADYDPSPLKLKREDVSLLIEEAEIAIDDFLQQASAEQRRALAFACIVPKRSVKDGLRPRG